LPPEGREVVRRVAAVDLLVGVDHRLDPEHARLRLCLVPAAERTGERREEGDDEDADQSDDDHQLHQREARLAGSRVVVHLLASDADQSEVGERSVHRLPLGHELYRERRAGARGDGAQAFALLDDDPVPEEPGPEVAPPALADRLELDPQALRGAEVDAAELRGETLDDLRLLRLALARLAVRDADLGPFAAQAQVDHEVVTARPDPDEAQPGEVGRTDVPRHRARDIRGPAVLPRGGLPDQRPLPEAAGG